SLAETIVEDAHAAANHELRRARRRRTRITTDARAARRPGKENARRKVVIAADVGLSLVTHSHRERQIRTNAPLILKKRAEIPLTDTGFRIATRDRKLRHATAQFTHVRIALEEQSATIALETGDRNEHRIAVRIEYYLIVCIELRRVAAGERKRAAEVLRREVSYLHAAHAQTVTQ